jgi:hypothetical protein
MKGAIMPNVQQPEMRRSEKDPLTEPEGGAAKGPEHQAPATEGKKSRGHGVPPDQQSPYGPQGKGRR